MKLSMVVALMRYTCKFETFNGLLGKLSLWTAIRLEQTNWEIGLERFFEGLR